MSCLFVQKPKRLGSAVGGSRVEPYHDRLDLFSTYITGNTPLCSDAFSPCLFPSWIPIPPVFAPVPQLSSHISQMDLGWEL